MSDFVKLIASINEAVALAEELPEGFTRSAVTIRLNLCVSLLMSPDKPKLREAIRASRRSNSTPTNPQPVNDTAVPRDQWPDNANKLAMKKIDTDKGLGDIWDRNKNDPMFIQTWNYFVIELVDCKTCRGNWGGILNRKYQF